VKRAGRLSEATREFTTATAPAIIGISLHPDSPQWAPNHQDNKPLTNKKEKNTMTSQSTRIRMHLLIKTAVAGIAALLLGGCAATNTTAPSTTPSATVRVQEWTGAYYGSAAAGKGTLDYKGRQHHFKISGIGAGGTGVQKVSATGKVYNLDNLQAFPGTYQGISKGLTLIEGKMHAKLTNGNGVVLYLAGETQGLASASGVLSYEITLTD
jgi:hypothetical protein